MKYIFTFFLVHSVYKNALVSSECKIITSRRVNTISFRCFELTELQKYLDKAKTNTTDIMISNSNVADVPGFAFVRFGKTLQSLDMHESGIQTLDPQAFIGLTNLERLILWGNELTWVRKEWFVNTYNLRTLDVSFNFLRGIDYPVFQMLPLLENFYFDYNQLTVIDFGMFAYLQKLKRVKFGKNPWKWPYRARLIWQMENQKVEYIDDWEDWSWMNSVVKKCVESGGNEMQSDGVLDCAVGILLQFVRDDSVDVLHSQQICNLEAQKLVLCMRPKNVTLSSNINYTTTARTILHDYVNVFKSMRRAQSPFVVTTS